MYIASMVMQVPSLYVNEYGNQYQIIRTNGRINEPNDLNPLPARASL